MKLRAHRIALATVIGLPLSCSLDYGTPSAEGCCSGTECPVVCADAPTSPAVANATWDCNAWTCNDGFVQCGGSDPCGVDLVTDPLNCGVCGHVCPAKTCSEGSCFPVTVVADGVARSPGLIAVSPDYVYVATDRGIERLFKDGSAPVPMADVKLLVALAADYSGVYWVDDQSVKAAQVPGQAPIALGMAGLASTQLLVDAFDVYWLTWVDDSATPDGGITTDFGGVWRVAKTGGAPELIGPYAKLQLGSAFGTYGGRVAYADTTNIQVVTPDAGATRVVAEQSPWVSTLATDSASIYWIASAPPPPLVSLCWGGCPDAGPVAPPTPDGIFRVPWDGGSVETVSNTGGLAMIVSTGTALWGLAGPPGTWSQLVRVDLATGEHTLVAGGVALGGFALDDGQVYWTRGTKVLSATQ